MQWGKGTNNGVAILMHFTYGIESGISPPSILCKYNKKSPRMQTSWNKNAVLDRKKAK